jgi:hypothetical protein
MWIVHAVVSLVVADKSLNCMYAMLSDHAGARFHPETQDLAHNSERNVNKWARHLCDC